MGFRLPPALWALCVAAMLAILPRGACAQPDAQAAAKATSADAAPALPSELERLRGRNLSRVEVVFDPPLWAQPTSVSSVRIGQTFTPELARRALEELGDTGLFGQLAAEAEPLGDGVLLRLRVVARRIVQALRVSGAAEAEELLRSAGVQSGSEVTARGMPLIARHLEQEYARLGYPAVHVEVQATDTDDPLRVLLSVDVTLGKPLLVSERHFAAWPDPQAEGLARVLGGYKVEVGARADRDAIENASRDLEEKLREAGFHNARVEDTLTRVPGGSRLEVRAYAGSRIVVTVSGNRAFDSDTLLSELKLDEPGDRSPSALSARLREYYVNRGFLDVVVDAELRGRENAPARDLVLRVHEGETVRVVTRSYPCLTGTRSPDDVSSEIDSFLAELPGGTLVDTVDPSTVDALYGPTQGTGRRAHPLVLNPYVVYSADAYDRAIEHLRDLFRSEGYLSATVGPVNIERRRCDVRSPAGTCVPLAPSLPATTACRYDPAGVPLPQPDPEPTRTCREDLLHSVHCESEVALSIPIELGPRTFVESVDMDGNLTIPDEDLLRAAELRVGAPLSQVEVDRARRRLLDRYAEEGFAFADVDAAPELSPDHRRAKVRFLISERRQVRVSRIVVRGARLTSESLIRSRIALEVGELYRRSAIRRTEERVATLGVFSGVTVGLEDPYVPASEKVVIVSVQERLPQSIETLVGLSSGEGLRVTLAYRNVNLFGQAVQLGLRVQAGYLPDFLIFEPDVRAKYRQLDSIQDRIERRDTLTLDFPQIGLGPLFRFSVQGVDVRDIARDFSLTKDAGIVTLFFIPDRRISFQLGSSLERNDANIFGVNPAQFRVPEGLTLVVAQRVAATWDRRDNPFGATRGTFLAIDVEHADARPLAFDVTHASADSAPAVCAAGGCAQQRSLASTETVQSDFLRVSTRVAGYVRLNERGLSLAASLRVGFNHQLPSQCERQSAEDRRSCTYPDRLFFMGGGDSLRGFTQDSLVPQDVADDVLNGRLSIDKVVIRGGDLMVNPRLELRIPVNEGLQTAWFVDAGNLWTRMPTAEGMFHLRYTTGTGLRMTTPIGPLAFDYGFNVDRVLDNFWQWRRRQRTWEDIGAFHFSIGLF